MNKNYLLNQTICQVLSEVLSALALSMCIHRTGARRSVRRREQFKADPVV